MGCCCFLGGRGGDGLKKKIKKNFTEVSKHLCVG